MGRSRRLILCLGIFLCLIPASIGAVPTVTTTSVTSGQVPTATQWNTYLNYANNWINTNMLGGGTTFTIANGESILVNGTGVFDSLRVTGFFDLGTHITPRATRLYHIGLPSRLLSAIYTDTMDAQHLITDTLVVTGFLDTTQAALKLGYTNMQRGSQDSLSIRAGGLGSAPFTSTISKAITWPALQTFLNISVPQPTDTSQAVNLAYFEKSSIGTQADYFFTATHATDTTFASPAMYLAMQKSEGSGTESSFSTGSLGTGTRLIGGFISNTPLKFLTLTPGIIDVHFFAQQTAGVGTTTIYCNIYERASGGALTLIKQTETSSALGSKQSYDLHAVLSSAYTFAATTSRIQVNFVEVITVAATTVSIFSEGTDDSRISFPTVSSAFANLDSSDIASGGVAGSSLALTLGNNHNWTGVQGFSDGSASAPGITFYNDTNTGLTRLGPDSLALVTGGVAYMKVGAGGVPVGLWSSATLPALRLTTGGEVYVGLDPSAVLLGVKTTTANSTRPLVYLWDATTTGTGNQSVLTVNQGYAGNSDYALRVSTSADSNGGGKGGIVAGGFVLNQAYRGSSVITDVAATADTVAVFLDWPTETAKRSGSMLVTITFDANGGSSFYRTVGTYLITRCKGYSGSLQDELYIDVIAQHAGSGLGFGVPGGQAVFWGWKRTGSNVQSDQATERFTVRLTGSGTDIGNDIAFSGASAQWFYTP